MRNMMRKIKLLSLCVVLMSLCSTAVAASTAICDHAARRAASDVGVPENIMFAISRVESGRTYQGVFAPWPWTVNRGGAGEFFASSQEATTLVRSAISRGETNIDIGCFQLNWYWHGKNFASLSDMIEPEKNAHYAAQFLRQLYEEKGSWNDAIANYHSRNAKVSSRYLKKINDVLGTDTATLDPPAVTPALPPPRQTAARRNDYPLLRGERADATLGSLVSAAQPRARQPLFLR